MSNEKNENKDEIINTSENDVAEQADKEKTDIKEETEKSEDKTKDKAPKSGKKGNKALIGVIIALALVIIGLLCFIVLGGNDKKSDSQNDGSTEISSDNDGNSDNGDPDKTEEEKNTESKDDKKEDKDESQKPDCYVTLTSGNSWENSGKVCAQLDAGIVNKSQNEIKNWTIEISVSDGTKIDSNWNCNCDIKNNVLTITPVEYNQNVAKGTTLKDIGIIVSANSKADIDAMTKNAKLLVDGKEYVSVSSADDKKDDNTDDKKDDEKTTESAIVPAEKPAQAESGTPFDNHGKLMVSGTDIVDKNGNKYQLKGVSTHGIAWFPEYVNKDAIKTFRDDWNANLFRIAMYTDENGGYCAGGDKENLKKLVDTGVQAATELGMYVIVDWHILHDLTPQKYKEEAKVFFEEMSSKYKNYDNVIYEICNEPNGGTSWSEVKSYAEEIIPIIRANDPDAIIIVGTPNWSQDVDIASNDPIKGYDNIMYAVHFYAATHTDGIRNKVVTAIDNGLPVFISEFSICDASGNGANDYNQADIWFELIDKYNLSYASWSVSNKDETSALIKSSCNKTSGWDESDLSDTGIYIRKKIKGIE